ncbi:MAG: type III pantothenate kinase [Kiritimatiellae bacterium]|nr:type III pantothenate kinase [Kiritimatiellia bacterium]
MKDGVIVVDIGNTSTSIGIYAAGRVGARDRLDTARASRAAVERKVRRCAAGRAVTGAMIASVVPAATSKWIRAVEKECRVKPLLVTCDLDLGIPITYPRPETIGADRLANASGAAARYGTPVIVADFGTALTFDIVLRKSGYVGGVIAPGLPLMFDYLAEKTALLPHVKPGRITHGVGKSTVEAIRMGAHWGYGGAVKEILAHLKRANRLSRVTLCATGGYADWVLKECGLPFVLDRDLTLFGLGRIFELNQGGL